MGNRKKFVMLGLDGAGLPYLRDLAACGVMPNLRELLAAGQAMETRTTTPELSCVAWTSMFTGLNPGGHGITGFTAIDPVTYKIKYPNFADVTAKCVWDILSRADIPSVAMNIPGTYPARQVYGAMVSGFVAVDFEKSVHPPGLKTRLKNIGYRLDVDTSLADENPEALLLDIHSALDKRFEGIYLLWEKEEWDLFFAVITETDRLHHYFHHALMDSGHSLHGRAVEVYRKIDRFLGNLYDRVRSIRGADRVFAMSSDHGFTAHLGRFNINSWLAEWGYLPLLIPVSTMKTSGIEENSPWVAPLVPEMKIFALDPGRIFFHTSPPYSRGGEYDAIALEKLSRSLAEKFEEHAVDENTGKSIVRRVHFKGELYRGEHVGMVPDIVVEARPGYEFKAVKNNERFASKKSLTGVHTAEGSFLFCDSRDIKPASSPDDFNPKPAIEDIAPSILNSMGLDRRFWEHMDGRPVLK